MQGIRLFVAVPKWALALGLAIAGLSVGPAPVPAAGPPTATTETASEVTVPAVTLNASVYPNGASTTYQFEYGPTPSYGAVVSVTPKSVGSGMVPVSVSETIGEIEPGSVYHYRVRATNSFGTTYGKDETFSYWGSWTLESPPNPTYANTSYLNDVACPSANNCLAVGHSSASEGKSITEHWNGEAWTLINGGADRFPGSVSCGSATVCWALGTQGTGSEFLLERFEYEAEAEEWWSYAYTKYKPVLPAGATALHLKAIACTAASECTAVGYYVKEGKKSPLAERLTSTGWAIQSTPATPGGDLTAVSCTAASACMAVGSQVISSQRKPLALRWDGTVWSTVAVKAPEVEGEYEERWLRAVSCASASICTATGHFWSEEPDAEGAIALRYSGASFELSTLPKLNGGSTLEDVSCPSTSSCLATGYNGEGSKTLAVAWDGAEWATQPSPTPSGKAAYLSGVACPKALSCVAVGRATGSGETATLAVRLGGSWTLESPPNPTYANTSYLNDVACPSANNCLAVGHSSASEGKSITEHWNGEAWTLINGGADRFPGSVSCGSATVCWALGTQGTGSEFLLERFEYEAEAEEWWSYAYTKYKPVLPAGATALHLKAIACTAASECTAVGYYVKEGKKSPLAERLTSTGWAIQSTPATPGGDLTAVSCTAASACMAVGSQVISSQRKPLALRWDGTVWSTVAVKAPEVEGEYEERWLRAVSCASASICTATGHFWSEEPDAEGAIALRYSGASFELSTLPKLNGGSTLEDVSCPSTSSCLATGYNGEGSKTLAVAWDGAEWATQPSPTPSGKAAYLSGVACPKALSCVAVGRATGSGETATLAVRLELNAPSATTAAATKVDTEEATLSGTVDTGGEPSTYWFEYGLSTAYGASVPAAPKALGGSSSPTPVSELLGGLVDGTTYHYRLVARNAAGTATGADQVLATVDLPETTITSSRPSYTSHEEAPIEFESSQPGSTFKCGLDEGETPTKTCTSPYTLPEKLEEGWHTFVVAAVNSEGRTDPTPAKYVLNPAIYPPAPTTSKLTTPEEGRVSAGRKFTSNEFPAGSSGYFTLKAAWGALPKAEALRA